jgi:AcrR family transcriptional regulator
MRIGPVEDDHADQLEHRRERERSAHRIKRVQARAELTDSKILDAAQVLFSEQGFDNTQLEQIAARAGYTRGAIYDRYEDKHELFLDLLERRIYSKLAAVYDALRQEPTVNGRLTILKDWIATRASDPSWVVLILEFKLYAIRHPDWRNRIDKIDDVLCKDHVRCWVEMLHGNGTAQSDENVLHQRLIVVGSTLCAMALENQFRPGILTSDQMTDIAERIFDTLITP